MAFSLESENMEETFRILQASGITIWRDPWKMKEIHSIQEANMGADGCLIAWLIDPDGNPIEIMEQIGTTMQRQYDHE